MVVRGFDLSGLTPAVKAAKVITLIGERMFQLHYEKIDKVSHFTLHIYSYGCIILFAARCWFRSQIHESVHY